MRSLLFKTCVAAGCVLFLLFPLFAEGSAPVLTFEDCVSEAASHNPDLAAAQESVNRANQQVNVDLGVFFPQVTGSLGANRSGTPASHVLSGTSNGDSIQKQYSAGLSAQENLFNGLHDSAQVKKDRAALEVAVAQLDAAKAQVSFDLRNAFASVLYAQESLNLTRLIADRRKENLQMVNLQFNVGQENKGSYLVSKAAYRQAQFEVNQAERNLRVSGHGLASVLGRPTFEVLVVTGTFVTNLPSSLPNFQDIAQKTPAVRQADAQLRSDEASVTISRSGFFPQLNASVAGSKTGDSWTPDSELWSAGLNLSYPLFSGGSTYHSYKGAVAQSRRSKNLVDSANFSAASSLDQAFGQFQNAVENIEVQQQTLDADQVRAEIARSQYQNGLVSFQDWDVIENNLISQQKQALQSYLSALSAENAWNQAQGKGWIQ